ncbi:MAG: NADH-quinone oxidoreductase subunit H [Hadesarchaea archaeon]|nr:NADH-quinone oxidoreductase subunit H [Hadesarchaea archaeon]
MSAAAFLFAYFVFPGLLFAGTVSLLLGGIDRKITGRMQNRVGPPIWQEFLDVGKLFAKEDITPSAAQGFVFTAAPFIALGSIVAIFLFLPVNSPKPALSSVADLIVIIYLLNIPAICAMLGGYSSACPFGIVGSSRYIAQLLGYELVFILAVLAAALRAGSLSVGDVVAYQARHGWLVLQPRLLPAAVAAVIASQGKMLRVPFDIPEAETEIVHGPLTEYSGPKLALFRIAYNMEIFAVAALVVALFFGGPVAHTIDGMYVPGVVSFLVKCFALTLLTTCIRNIAARLKIDQALKFFWAFAASLALISLVLVL